MTFPWIWRLHFMGWPAGGKEKRRGTVIPKTKNSTSLNTNILAGAVLTATTYVHDMCILASGTHHPSIDCCTSCMRWQHPLYGQTPLQLRPPLPGALASKHRTHRTTPGQTGSTTTPWFSNCESMALSTSQNNKQKRWRPKTNWMINSPLYPPRWPADEGCSRLFLSPPTG